MLETDLTDEQWQLIKPLIPLQKWGGRKRSTCERHVVDSILYVVKTGCQWRQLHRYPDLPWQTVYRYFIEWRKARVWKKIQAKLVMRIRKENGREAHPSVIVIDSQSTKTGKCAAIVSRGIDGGKRVKGRKRHMAVDTSGLLIDVSVTPANTHDTKGGMKVISRIARSRQLRDSIQTIYADKGYSGITFADWAHTELGASVEIGDNKAKVLKRFVPDKKRWVVERSFAWLRDYKRLIEDHERKTRNSVSMIRIAFIRVMLRRLHPVGREWY